MKQDIKVVQGQELQDGTGIVVPIREHSVSLIPRGTDTSQPVRLPKPISLHPDSNTRLPLTSILALATEHGVAGARKRRWFRSRKIDRKPW